MSTEKLDRQTYQKFIEERINVFNDLEYPKPKNNQQLTYDLYELTKNILSRPMKELKILKSFNYFGIENVRIQIKDWDLSLMQILIQMPMKI